MVGLECDQSKLARGRFSWSSTVVSFLELWRVKTGRFQVSVTVEFRMPSFPPECEKRKVTGCPTLC
jgi:hypothetical protein